ncbi:type IV pilin protein [Variovorax humicola]|uniref:Type IV pilin protein n=1 Tax=Variovorax humicola TaxID=1769758 RepID=A0ABU8W9A7_9BURK
MSLAPSKSSQRARGFSLIELMIAVAIIAILAAVAYPSYTRYIVRSNRAAAQGYMLEVSGLQQRYLLDARAYAVQLSDLPTTVPATVASNYLISTEPVTGPPPGFLVKAVPINSQLAHDAECGTLSVNQASTKTVTGTGTTCW